MRQKWFFDCGCPRCLDPTELGSYYGALLCQRGRRDLAKDTRKQIKGAEDVQGSGSHRRGQIEGAEGALVSDRGMCGGAVVSSDPGDNEAEFRCEECGGRLGWQRVRSVLGLSPHHHCVHPPGQLCHGRRSSYTARALVTA